MKQLDRTFDAVTAALRRHVLPQVEDDFARGQLYGAIYMLEQLRLQVDWAVPPLLVQVARQRQAADEIISLCAGSPDAPVPPRALVSPIGAMSGGELLALRDMGDDWLSSLLDWLETASGGLDSERIAAIETAVRACARDVNAVEARQTPRPMFAQIASGRDVGDERAAE